MIAFELLSKQGKDPIQMPPPLCRESLFALMHPLMMVVVDVRLVLKPRLLSLWAQMERTIRAYMLP